MDRAKSTSRPLDRISGLPLTILSHILSFLPTKDAVATHILSKSWSFLWTLVNNLDFSYSSGGGYKDTEFGDFVNFVNYVMLYHKPDAGYLNKLSLTLYEGDAWINAWICSAVAKNVRQLFVSGFSYRPPIHVQTRMFTSEWLQSLELDCSIHISSAITVSLPRLEHLKLIISLDHNNEEAYRKLINGCPVLKYLYIDVRSIVPFSKCINISSTSLRHLELYLRAYSGRHHYSTPATDIPSSYSIKLDAPSLEYIKLELAKTSCIAFIQESFTSLKEANFHSYLLPSAFNSAAKAIQAFDCAKTLTLSAAGMEALSSATINLSTKFKRLTRLEVTLDLKHLSVLQDLISLSDNLQVLTIKRGYQTRAADYLTSSNWKTLDLVPLCLSNSLKTVSIDAYYGHVDELAMVAYTLKHGSVLQRMQICFDKSITDIKTKFEIVQKISKFPRKSLCEVEFS